MLLQFHTSRLENKEAFSNWFTDLGNHRKVTHPFTGLLGMENQRHTVVSRTDDKLTIRSEGGTQDGAMVPFVFTCKRSSTCIPCTQGLVRGRSDEEVRLWGRVAEKSRDRFLQIRKSRSAIYITVAAKDKKYLMLERSS